MSIGPYVDYSMWAKQSLPPYSPGDKVIVAYNEDFLRYFEGRFYMHIGPEYPLLRMVQPDVCGVKIKQPQYGYKLGGHGYIWKEVRVPYSQVMKCPEQSLI